MMFTLTAGLDPERVVFLSEYSLRKIVGLHGFELHGFWAGGVLGVPTSGSRRPISLCRDVVLVGRDMDVLFFFFLGIVFFEFRHGIIPRERDTVHPWWFVLGFVDFVVDGCLSSGSDHRDWVWRLRRMRCPRVREGTCGSFLSGISFRIDFNLRHLVWLFPSPARPRPPHSALPTLSIVPVPV